MLRKTITRFHYPSIHPQENENFVGLVSLLGPREDERGRERERERESERASEGETEREREREREIGRERERAGGWIWMPSIAITGTSTVPDTLTTSPG